MDPTGQNLLKLMFNEGESVCVSSNKYPYHSVSLPQAMEGSLTLVPEDPENPTEYCNSSDLTMVAINPIIGFRKDNTVTKFRTFLWEIDTGSIEEQLGYLKHLKIPLSSQVFSGSKSIHALTILDKDLPDEKTYRDLYKWALNILTMCDQNCKNPSRSTRIPGAYREPGKQQQAISLGNRVPLSEFIAWLNRYPHLRPIAKPKKVIIPGQADFSRLSRWAQVMLKEGITFKNGRNKTYFALAYDFALAGFSIEVATEELLRRFTEEHDFKEKELMTAINSAFKTVEEGK